MLCPDQRSAAGRIKTHRLQPIEHNDDFAPTALLFTAARTSEQAGKESSRVELSVGFTLFLLHKVELRGCSIKYCDSDKGFGIYTSADAPEDGVLLVVPLDLAITPMRWSACLQTLHGSRRYLDMLPTTFGNPLWFTDGEVEELKGTALYRASKLQNAEMRCLLSRHLLAGGFFPVETSQNDCNSKAAKVSNYSWSGKRRMPSYLSKLVFPEDFLTALRTISMKEDQLYQVSSMLEELVGSEDRQLLETEVRTAVWEACGDSGAFQLLVDLLQTNLKRDLELKIFDTQLLENAKIESTTQPTRYNDETNGSSKEKYITRNTWSAIVYRKGQKHLTRLFLKEAEHALELSLNEEKSSSCTQALLLTHPNQL
ncbi:unnamed protein product [Rhodiola kirilowii]